jgi:S-DNA-T family DNA segregation ATPase FtsK/SpoIIIE
VSSGLLLVMASAGTALAALNLRCRAGSFPQGAGGILGHALGSADQFAAFSAVGARLILVAVFLFGMTIFTDLSWLKLMDRLGALALARAAARASAESVHF